MNPHTAYGSMRSQGTAFSNLATRMGVCRHQCLQFLALWQRQQNQQPYRPSSDRPSASFCTPGEQYICVGKTGSNSTVMAKILDWGCHKRLCKAAVDIAFASPPTRLPIIVRWSFQLAFQLFVAGCSSASPCCKQWWTALKKQKVGTPRRGRGPQVQEAP